MRWWGPWIGQRVDRVARRQASLIQNEWTTRKSLCRGPNLQRKLVWWSEDSIMEEPLLCCSCHAGVKTSKWLEVDRRSRKKMTRRVSESWKDQRDRLLLRQDKDKNCAIMYPGLIQHTFMLHHIFQQEFEARSSPQNKDEKLCSLPVCCSQTHPLFWVSHSL